VQLRLYEPPAVDLLLFEKRARRRGFQRIAGIDEVGRGPLAGPVMAAAVILPVNAELSGVKDSKQLSRARREALAERIRQEALAVGIGSVDAETIDRVNILQATFLAMRQAVAALPVEPDFLLIDGPYQLPLPFAQSGIRQGDRKSLSIAAASIVAKVERDRLMRSFHERYPVYAFAENMGYGTRAHREALRRHGPCPLHRRSFKGVEDAAAENLGDDHSSVPAH
jgi:ribonuclease HII